MPGVASDPRPARSKSQTECFVNRKSNCFRNTAWRRSDTRRPYQTFNSREVRL